jgi:CheY-like chemotaxis protein
VKALVVHGRPVEALELCQTLVDAGAQVQYAPSAVYALELLEREQPDVIICEQGLSDMGGHEFLGILRVEELYESIPFILLSQGTPQIAQHHAVLPTSTSVATVSYFAHEMIGELQPKPAPSIHRREALSAPVIQKLTDLQPGETIEMSPEELAQIIEQVIA